jgi:hypothetical protein
VDVPWSAPSSTVCACRWNLDGVSGELVGDLAQPAQVCLLAGPDLVDLFDEAGQHAPRLGLTRCLFPATLQVRGRLPEKAGHCVAHPPHHSCEHVPFDIRRVDARPSAPGDPAPGLRQCTSNDLDPATAKTIVVPPTTEDIDTPSFRSASPTGG